MIKILFVVVALGFAGWYVKTFLLNDPYSPEEWPEYRNSRYSFKINYPPNWSISEQTANNAGVDFVSSEDNLSCRVYGFANSYITEDGDPQALEELITWISEEEVELDRHETKLGGKRAIRIVTEVGEMDKYIKDSIYTLLDDDTGRAVYCIYGNESLKQKYDDTMERMVQSFELTSTNNLFKE